jgi:hypothetical protein
MTTIIFTKNIQQTTIIRKEVYNLYFNVNYFISDINLEKDSSNSNYLENSNVDDIYNRLKNEIKILIKVNIYGGLLFNKHLNVYFYKECIESTIKDRIESQNFEFNIIKKSASEYDNNSINKERYYDADLNISKNLESDSLKTSASELNNQHINAVEVDQENDDSTFIDSSGLTISSVDSDELVFNEELKPEIKNYEENIRLNCKIDENQKDFCEAIHQKTLSDKTFITNNQTKKESNKKRKSTFKSFRKLLSRIFYKKKKKELSENNNSFYEKTMSKLFYIFENIKEF